MMKSRVMMMRRRKRKSTKLTGERKEQIDKRKEKKETRFNK